MKQKYIAAQYNDKQERVCWMTFTIVPCLGAAVQLLMLFTFMYLDFELSGFSTYLQSQTGKTQWKFGGAANDKIDK